MFVRRRLARRITPLLDPGEAVVRVFVGVAGRQPQRAWSGRMYRPIAVTNRSIRVWKSQGASSSRPTELLATLTHREIQVSRLGMTQLGLEEMWIHWRFRRDVRAANRYMDEKSPRSD